MENPRTFSLATGNTWKRICNTNSELSQNCAEKQIAPFFLYKQSIFDPRPKNCLSFLKHRPKKSFSKCLVDGLLTSLECVMHTFELTFESPKVSISPRFPMQKKGFSLFSQWIV